MFSTRTNVETQPGLLSLRLELQRSRLAENQGRVAAAVLAEEEVRGWWVAG